MNKNEFHSERFEFINELLTGEELLERLAAAQQVVQGLTAQVELHKQIATDMKRAAEVRDDFAKELQEMMTATAVMLTGIGDDDHRHKNEAILRASHDLLVMARKKLWELKPRHYRDMDDIPF